ncbi:MAG: hypothetical protein CVV02_00435 [Firmicutes bacterium HGW-Firmicutes-7]|nr:MAG: hypothetical protein CVV02_00435 [Firmicutes bacterium HGW-Firmicutes-7]
MNSSENNTCYLIGEASLLIKCGEILINNGFIIKGVISKEKKICEWATNNDLDRINPKEAYFKVLKKEPFDFLFSIVNYQVLKKDVLDLPKKMAINFHDAILPRYGGIHATSWALLNDEKVHGITWHIMEEGVDQGNILKQKTVEIDNKETAFSLNLKCYIAAVDAFEELVKELTTNTYTETPQKLEDRTYFEKNKRPENGGIVSWPTSAEAVDRLVRAMDFGGKANGFGCVKIVIMGHFYIISKTEILRAKSNLNSGKVLKVEKSSLVIGTTTYNIRIYLKSLTGKELDLFDDENIKGLQEGYLLENVDGNIKEKINTLYSNFSKYESYWKKRLVNIEKPIIQDISRIQESEEDFYIKQQIQLPNSFINYVNGLENGRSLVEYIFIAISAFIARIGENQFFDIGFSSEELKLELAGVEDQYANIVPYRVEITALQNLEELFSIMGDYIENINKKKTYPFEMISRQPELFAASEEETALTIPIVVEQNRDLKEIHSKVKGDLVFLIDDRTMNCHIIFKGNKYDEKKTIELMKRLTIFLSEIALKPNTPVMKTNILTTEEYNKIVVEWNNKSVEYPREKCTYELIEEQVIKTPDRIAVIYEAQQLSYKELNDRADQLSRYLKCKGIQEGKLIGVFMERSIDLLVVLIGIWKAGCAYVPLDPIYPKERLLYMIEDAHLPLIITQSDLIGRLPDTAAKKVEIDLEKVEIFDETTAMLPSKKGRSRKKLSTKDRLAYVIFTSGSTGKPKGVEITQRGLTNYLWFVVESQGFTEKDKFMALTTICFDISLCELFANLIKGGQVEILPTEMQRDPYLLMEKIENNWTTAIQATPATWEMLLSVGWNKKLPLKIYCGGEAMSPELAEKLIPRCSELWNIYGPTEATIWSSIHHIKSTAITIGHPIYNTQYYVLDKYLNPVPEGTPGELYIGGDGLARGYLNRKDMTAERFISNPFDFEKSDRIYKTGDFVKFLPGGEVEWLGRIDNQVKLRGFRIELGEIETVLKQQEEIDSAVVVLREYRVGFKGLYAFILAEKAGNLNVNTKLNEKIKEYLPGYMMPRHYVYLKHFPLTMNNKVDRKSLTTMTIDEIKNKYGDHERNKIKESRAIKLIENLKNDLLNLAAKVLKVDGGTIDFVTPLGEYGFDSVSFTELSVRIKEKYNVTLSPAIFYSYATLEKLSNYIFDVYEEVILKEYKEPSIATNQIEKAKGAIDEKALQALSSIKYNENLACNNKTLEREPVAIIGIGGIMPLSPNLELFWDNLINERDMITEVPKDRWDPNGFYGEAAMAGTNSNPARAGFVEDVDKFDAAFFNISPREAQLMDPQQRLFMETAWKTVEDAGYKPSDLSNSKTGVYVGVVATDYWDLMSQNPLNMDTFTTSGRINCVIANRISYMFNLRGPSAVIDTACSSSLVAVHRAVAAIQDGYCDGAIAGGVNVMVNPFFHVAIGKKGMLSGDGRCKTFDKAADGYVRAEGVGAIYLKPLSKAKADGDYIYAVIKSSAENHGGRSNSFTAPSAEAQTELLVEAYEKAGISPDTISYIETHGTGTSLGDPIEVNALKAAFNKMYDEHGETNSKKGYCGIGSVKTNIGHLEAGAGIAGMLKVLLSMKHGVLPGNINFNEMNPYIDIENSPLYLVKKTKEWTRIIDDFGNIIPRRAGISSFGFGGSNSHVTLEEYPENKVGNSINTEPQLIILSAKNEDRLKLYTKALLEFIQKNKGKEEIPLRSIAFTLQKGREEMEDRLAIITSSLTDLEEKLYQYVNGMTNIDNLFTNNIKGNKTRTKLLMEGNEGENFLKSIINNKRLSKLAQLWIIGVDINWDIIYSDNRPRRVPLPTYPFEKVRHWIPTQQSQNNNDLGFTSKGLHPFIDSNESTLEEQIYVKSIHKVDDSIKDHIANYDTIFPGVAYLEMARAAGQLANNKGLVVKLQNNVWPKALVLKENPIVMTISLNPTSQGVEYKVGSNDEEGNSIHAQGKLEYNNSYAPEEFLDIPALKAKMGNSLTKDACYHLFSNAGYQYGNTYKSIEQLYYSQTEALAQIKLPLECRASAKEFVLPPALVDGALQSVIVFIGNSFAESGTIFMPFAMGELEILSELPEKCFSYAIQTHYQEGASYSVAKFAIYITDEAGKVLVKIKDFSLRGLVPSNQVKRSVENPPSMYYRINSWELASVEAERGFVNVIGNTMVFDDSEEIFQGLETKLKDNLRRVVLVKPGLVYKELEGNIFEINMANQEDYSKLLRTLLDREMIPDNILHLLSKDNLSWNYEKITNQLKDSVYSMLYLSQAIIDLKQKNKIKFVYILRPKKIGWSPQYSAVKSFLKVLENENTRFCCKTVETLPISNVKMVELCMDELGGISAWKDKMVRYEAGKRFVAKYVNRVENAEVEVGELPIVDEGVYIISGGAGSLGLLFAEYLAKKAKVNLILLGRSELDDERAKRLKEIEALGSEVTYFNMDISKAKDVERMIKETREKYSRINGIIHCAGVTKDSFIFNKKQEEVDAVIAPKVWGTIWLDELTKDDKLDFFVMFSSISSILGNTGQSDYAYANGFMDDYAKMREFLKNEGRRYGKTLSIGWPFWKTGGMKIASETEKFLINTLGIVPMEVEEGIHAFEIGLTQKENHFIVLKGYKEKFNALFEKNNNNESQSLLEEEVKNKNVHNEPKEQGASDSEKELLEMVIKELISFTSKVQKLNLKDIEPLADISEFGFDSIGFTELSNEINGKYNINIMPSIFFEHSTLDSLAKYLVKEYYEQLKAVHKGYQKRENVVLKTKNNDALLPSLRFKQWSNKKVITEVEEEEEVIDKTKSKAEVAIVGMSGVMPQSKDLKEFWDNLEAGKDLITEIPKERWNYNEYFGDPTKEDNKTNVKWGGFMKEVDKFDPLFFGISPKEAVLMDPQQRIFLENAWKSLEDCGLKPSDISGSNTGVFIGAGAWDYLYLLKENDVDIQAQTSSGVSFSILANRVSYLLNLNGPSETIDTACSSSLVALQRAVEQIQNGHCDMAFAGGINVMSHPAIFISLSKAGMLCEDGRCKTFDKAANGYVRGEGCGVLLLKNLSQAIKDKNHIYGVIKGSATNHGGHANSLTTPNPNAQAEVIQKAWSQAQVNPSTITYIETHGTGTSLGDPIEINGLKKAFDQLNKEWGTNKIEAPYCGLGALKTNIGHLEWGSGIAGVIKVLLAMKYKRMPASIHFNEQNPYINLKDSPFYIIDKTMEWKSLIDEDNRPIPRRAGVSSFGFGGVNAHIALEEYEDKAALLIEKETQEEVVLLSAKNEERLIDYVGEMITFIKESEVKSASLEVEYAHISSLVQNEIKLLAAIIMHVNKEEISCSRALEEYGFDLISFHKLVEQIGDRFKIEVKTTEVTSCATIEEIAEHLWNKGYRTLKKQFSKNTNSNILQEIEYSINLKDLAYTLRTGREEMEVRLAIVTNSVKDLISKLEQFVKGYENIEGVAVGSIKADKLKIDFLVTGDKGKELIRALIEDQKLLEVAQLWTSGVKIEWSKLIHNHICRLISLPTYPFAKERYWITDYMNGRSRSLGNKGITTTLHPLVHKNTSNLYEQRFTTLLNKKAFYLKDHVVKGESVLPGAAIIEMVRAAGQMCVGSRISKISDIIWVKPIIVEQSEEIHISLLPEGEAIEYEVVAMNEDHSRTIYSQGKLSMEADEKEEPIEYVDIEEIKRNCVEKKTGENCYKKFEKMAFNYGESFQSIKELYCGEEEAISRLELAASLMEDFDEFILHPALLDGALQTIIGIKNPNVEGEEVYLPFTMGEVEILKPLEKECYAYGRLNNSFEKDTSKIRKYTIIIADTSGRVMVRINDFVMRAIVPNELRKTEDVHYFHSQWINKVLEHTAHDELQHEHILIFDTNENFYNMLQKKMPEHQSNIWLVKPGKSFRKVGENIIEIDPEDSNAYKLLIEMLRLENQMPDYILHAWSKESFEEKKERLKIQLDLSVFSVFNLCKALIAEKINKKVKVVYIHERFDGNIQPHYRSISGLAKTINNENPNLMIKTVEVDVPLEIIDRSLEELIFGHQDREVRYEDGLRTVRSYEKLELDRLKKEKDIPIIDNGVYLITGGVGELGLIFAEYFARRTKVKLVLTGRSNLNDAKLNRMKEIEKLGSKVTYIKCDISKKDNVVELIHKIKNEFGNIHGIIHAAGVVKDSFLLKKSLQEMKAVIGPKLYGTIWLDEATKDEKLDFFVMFSSIASVIGNIGQSDYAYANSFLDNYVYFREAKREKEERSGMTISINWPLWIEGGMKMDESATRRMKEAFGFSPITTSIGLKAFEDALTYLISNMLVVKGEESSVRSALELQVKDDSLNNKQEVIKNSRNNDLDLVGQLEERLKIILSKEINLPTSRISILEPFEKYGIDSIMIVSLNRVLENHFGKLSKTLLFEVKNIKELAVYLIENHRNHLVDLEQGAAELHTNEAQIKPIKMAFEKENINKPRFFYKGGISSENSFYKEKDIAIIGMSGRYPMANNLNEFWENLKAGKDCITEIPEERWDKDEYYDPDKNAKGKSYSKWGGFIEDVDKFDPMFFNISPKEAEFMDPQERIFLETVWHTIEDAGYTRAALEQEKVGVFAGIMYNHYPMYAAEESIKGNVIAVNSSYASVANRVSYYLNLRGPSIALDTMCSSSITAVHLACESIKRGESDLAIAGGVNVTIHPNKYILLSQGKFAASDGKCKSFGEGGDGYVPGEGVGALLLKPLEKAIADGDKIYSVIKGSALNHGGKTNGYSVPSPKAQGDLILEAFKRAQIDPRTISYVEAHGTGTSLGDPIEIAGLVKAFHTFTKEQQFCAIGSAKSNIGHLESAAGIAGITKVLLQMQHKQLVPSIHSDSRNPNIDFEESPFYVQHEVEEWKNPVIDGKKYPRRAGISSFGAGGSNAHIILEEYEKPALKSISREPQLILISARDEERLRAYLQEIIQYLEGQVGLEQPSLEDIAYTLQVGREGMEERIGIVASTIQELISKLKKGYEAEYDNKEVIRGRIKKSKTKTEDINGLENNQKRFLELFKAKNFSELAKEWVLGEEINWKTMNYGSKASVISLPVYPFARERYWITQVEERNTRSDNHGNNLRLHPLINSNISTLKEQRFSTIFSGEEFYFTDHIVHGKKMLPGAVYLEMAKAAGDLSEDNKVVKIKDILWAKPIIIFDSSKEINISLVPEEEYVAYEISEKVKGEEKIIYSKGKVVYETLNESKPIHEVVNLERIKNKFTKALSKQACYEAFNKRGIQYGTSFQVIEELFVGQKDALGIIKLPKEAKDIRNEFVLHPSIIDGCFQVVMGVGYDIKKETNLYLPFSVDEVQLFDELVEEMFVYVELIQEGVGSKEYNISLLDFQGRVLIKMTNFSIMAYANTNSTNSNNVEVDKLMELLNMLYAGEVEVAAIKDMMGVLINEQN